MKRLDTDRYKVEGKEVIQHRGGGSVYRGKSISDCNTWIADRTCRWFMGYYILESNETFELRQKDHGCFIVHLPLGMQIFASMSKEVARHFFYNNCTWEDTKYCWGTKKLFDGESVTYQGRVYSMDYAKANFTKCAKTGEWVPNEEIGNYYGEKCSFYWLRNFAVLCSRTQNWFNRCDVGQERGGGWTSLAWLRDHQYWYCAGFRRWQEPNITPVTVEGLQYNLDFARARFFPDGNGGWSRTQVRDNSAALVLPNEVVKVLYGVEIEMEQPQNEPVKCFDNPMVSYKPDGSLRHGIEMVTRPFSWAYWNEKGRDLLATVLAQHIKHGSKAFPTASAGLHVHVDKRAWDNAWHVAKSIQFLNRNPDFATELSEREPDRMNQWSTPRITDGLSQMAKAAMQHFDKPTFHRYRALNVNPPWTNEFRMFRGNLAIDGIQRALETVRAIIAFSREAGYNDLTRSHFLVYVKQNAHEYRTFVKWLELKGMLPTTGTKKSEKELVLCA